MTTSLKERVLGGAFWGTLLAVMIYVGIHDKKIEYKMKELKLETSRHVDSAYNFKMDSLLNETYLLKYDIAR